MRASEETQLLLSQPPATIPETVNKTDMVLLRRYEFWLCRVVRDNKQPVSLREHAAFVLRCIYERFPKASLTNDCRALRTVQVLAESAMSEHSEVSLACMRTLLVVLRSTTTLPPAVAEQIKCLLDSIPVQVEAPQKHRDSRRVGLFMMRKVDGLQ